ncbi:MAG: ligand-gated channel protein [Neisseriaceae bacterium]|nr:ligand-gated channel protein [Neisseriaceae bacterium]
MSNRKLPNAAIRTPLKPSLVALSLLAASFSAQAANQDSAQIDDVVVTASGFQQKANTAAASISVITQKQLENKAYKDVTDALKDAPGVVVTGGGSKADISIRGMASGYTLIMIDGKRVDSRGTRPNSDGSGIEQGWLPPIEAIQRIEVIRGPMSALYGSDAMGGVINIITKKTTQGQWRSSIRTEMTIQEDGDSGDQFQTNVFTTGPIIDGVLGMRANAQFSKRNEDKFAYGFNEQKNSSGEVTFTLTPDEFNTIDLDFSRSMQTRNRTLGKSAIESDVIDNLDRYDRTQYALTHSGDYEDIKTTSYIQREETENKTRSMENNNTIFNTQTQFLLGDHSLTLGGQYKHEELKDESGNGNKVAAAPNRLTRYNWSLFAEDQWQMNSSFALTGAIRLDKDENYGSHWTPKLYGVWQANPNWIIKGGVSAGYKTPSLRATAPNWWQITGKGASVIIGNPDLKPEKSVSTELAFVWNNLQDKEVSFTLFNNEFKDKISEVRDCSSPGKTKVCQLPGYDDQYFNFISSRTNVDKATIRGIEATFNWDLTSDLSLDTSYTYTDSEQKSGDFKGKPLNKMPKHMINATLDWQAQEQLNVWGRVNYRSKSSEALNRAKMDTNRLPAVTFVDLGLSYKPSKSWMVNAGVYNLFDKTIDAKEYDTAYDGRRYHVGATYKF